MLKKMANYSATRMKMRLYAHLALYYILCVLVCVQIKLLKQARHKRPKIRPTKCVWRTTVSIAHEIRVRFSDRRGGGRQNGAWGIAFGLSMLPQRVLSPQYSAFFGEHIL